MYSYKPNGVCSRKIDFEVVDGKITEIAFTGGCAGNLLGISTLVKGMDVHEVIKKLKGIKCSDKNTSCPDQFAIALEEYLTNA